MKVVIIIPSYNERDNIGRLIDTLEKVFETRPQNEYSVLVVDGNSPDGTGDIVKQKGIQNQNIHLYTETKKSGLGAAYVLGFRYAMQTFNPDILIEMDADFQHDPNDVVRLTDEIENGYDYVIGSRFVKGGSLPEDWEFHRKLLSIGGNIFSKIVLGIYSVNDFTSGFKASRVQGFVDKLDLGGVMSSGFAYKIDLLYKMHRLGAKIKEVPISFGLRNRGDSKMERNNFMDSLKVVITLRLREHENMVKFLIVGIIGLAVDLSLFNIIRLFILSSISALFSGGIAMLTTFLINNFWSFKNRGARFEVSKNNVVSLALSLVLIPLLLISGTLKLTDAVLYSFALGILTNLVLNSAYNVGNSKLSVLSPSFKNVVVAVYIMFYFVASSIPILIRSNLIGFSVIKFGDTFLASNFAFFVGVAFGLVWNFTVYSKIIWKKQD